jgi:2-polyprenyl-3-methyl-5-hydroxy-6-metoxy-1,4-benzoquinol methylase
MPNYGDATYWDERYNKSLSETFDWLESWKDIKDIVEQNAIEGLYYNEEPLAQMAEAQEIKNNLKILNLGCGNSELCEHMYDEGYLLIDNMDISEVCINQMKERNDKKRE